MLQLANGQARLITGNTAADPTVITLDAAHVLTTTEAADLIGTAATVRAVTACTATITGASGVATGMTSSVTSVPVSALDDLNLTFIANETLRQFVDRINSTTNYRASIGGGVNGDTTLMKTFDFGTRATAVDVRFDAAISPSTKGTFRRDLQDAIDWINDHSELITATRSTSATAEGSELPLVTGGVAGTAQDTVVYLVGGTRGISSNTNWQDAFDLLLKERINHVVPLISQDLTNEGYSSTATFKSVAAQLAAFVNSANSSAKNECGGYIGMKGTRTDLINQTTSLNNKDIQLFGQKFTVLDVDGNLTEQQEWAAAVMAAGMRAGLPEVGEPLTFKLIQINGLSQDASWDWKDITDANALIKEGVMFAAQKPGGGFRWVRDITTYKSSTEEFFTAGSTRDATRYVAYDFRFNLEEKFTGLKAKPATVASIREAASVLLEGYRQQSIIVESLDPETGTKTHPGWRNLRVFISGNTAIIRVEIFPVQGITFEHIDITLQNVKLAA